MPKGFREGCYVNAFDFVIAICASIVIAVGVSALGLLIMAWATDDIGLD